MKSYLCAYPETICSIFVSYSLKLQTISKDDHSRDGSDSWNWKMRIPNNIKKLSKTKRRNLMERQVLRVNEWRMIRLRKIFKTSWVTRSLKIRKARKKTWSSTWTTSIKNMMFLLRLSKTLTIWWSSWVITRLFSSKLIIRKKAIIKKMVRQSMNRSLLLSTLESRSISRIEQTNTQFINYYI